MSLINIQRLTAAEAINTLEPYADDNRNATSHLFLDINDDFTLKGIFFDDTEAGDKKIVVIAGNLTIALKNGKVLSAAFVGNPKITNVVFVTEMANADYSVSFSTVSTGNSSFLPKLSAKTVNGFIINMNTNNIARLTSVDWMIMNVGDL